jgi:mannose-6-phosphate isomerase-like protein (cupin superfamily)
MSKKNQIAVRLGQKIRSLRRQKKITLIELSKNTGIAQATLSRMETGLMVGTVSSHQQIAESLGVSVSELYLEIDSRLERTKHQSSSETRKVTAKNDQMKYELLTQEISKKKITPLLLTLQAQGKTEREQSERGVEKFLFVLEGNVKVTLNEDEYVLNPQDTLYFDASMAHQVANAGNKPARIFCAVSPAKI